VDEKRREEGEVVLVQEVRRPTHQQVLYQSLEH
jgi:hypothetical protein